MIKFLLTIIGVLVADVGFLFYLLTNPNFIPMDATGRYISLNIFIFFFMLFVVLCCVLILAIWGGRKILIKSEDENRNIRLSVVTGSLLTVGILAVYLLHFFHILNFLWGLSILLIGIILLFVI